MHLFIRSANHLNLQNPIQKCFQLGCPLLLLKPLGVCMCHSLTHLWENMHVEAAAIKQCLPLSRWGFLNKYQIMHCPPLCCPEIFFSKFINPSSGFLKKLVAFSAINSFWMQEFLLFFQTLLNSDFSIDSNSSKPNAKTNSNIFFILLNIAR